MSLASKANTLKEQLGRMPLFGCTLEPGATARHFSLVSEQRTLHLRAADRTEALAWQAVLRRALAELAPAQSAERVLVDGVEQEETPDDEYCDPYGTSWCEVGADGRFRAHQEVKDAHATNDACTAVGEWVGEGTSTAACGEWGQETTCSTFKAPSPPPSEPASPLYPSSSRCEQYCGAAACAAILFGPCKRWRGSLQRYEECDLLGE